MPTVSKLATAAVLAGLVLAQQGCGSARDPVAAPAPAASSATAATAATPSPEGSPEGKPEASPEPSRTESRSPSASPATGPARGIPGGDRQVVIKPVEPGGESILAVDAKGRLNATDGDTGRGLFVLTRVGKAYQIRTAKAGTGGEPSCMGVRSNGGDPLTVVAAACDTARRGQLFTIDRESGGGATRPGWSIRNGDAFLQLADGYGLIAQELGDSELRTTFAFVDNGRSTLPRD